ncbi:transmembrane protein 248-like [Patiria miniata]|uniref:TMEM248/TMEM219 domain-containing protein n=1 Tax=Patiria miniata TaxID=46514 RepID=A0A913ZWI0_PATMI|nr:transmembrane protein 248-like [Patiria miniata]
MAYKPIENLKGHVKSRPPVVIFIGCMFLFALSVVILGYYFKNSEVPNYDISEDWNHFLGDLSSIDFCLTLNTSTVTSAIATVKSHTLENSSLSLTTDPFPIVDYDEDWAMKRNLSVSIMLLIEPSVYMAKTVANVTMMSSLVPASMLGHEGPDEMVSVQFELPQTLKLPQSKDSATRPLVVQTCLTLIGSPSVFPMTKQPASCNTTDSHHENSTAWMRVRPKRHPLDSWCKQGTMAHAKHKFDPRLTVMLSSAEQSIINLHLMYTSYFMFVMVIMWVCYALVKGPPTKMRNLHNTATEKKSQPSV